LNLNDAVIVVKHLLTIISRDMDESSELPAFVCMNCLTFGHKNTRDTAAILATVQAHPGVIRLLELVASLINTFQSVAVHSDCLQFIINFTMGSSERQALLFLHDAPLAAVFVLCTNGTYGLPANTRTYLAIALFNLLDFDVLSNGDDSTRNMNVLMLRKFLDLGGLKAVVNLTTVGLLRRESNLPEEESGSEVALDVLHRLFVLLMRHRLDLLSTRLCMIAQDDLPALAVTLYARLQGRPHGVSSTVTCVISLCVYLTQFHYPARVVERFVMHTMDGQVGAKSLIGLNYEVAQTCGSGANAALCTLQEMKSLLPHLAARIDAELQIVVKDEKDRHCALPGCSINGTSLSGVKMMKCGRCLAAYYCCKEHQVQHWRGHKRTCAPPIVT
jgi:hypothetical protein